MSTSQAKMKCTILDELKGATFSVDLTAPGAPLQANPDDVQRVFGRLGVDHVTLFADGPSTVEGAPWLPSGGFKQETNSYRPIAYFLNTIIRSVNSCLPGPRYLQALRFETYGLEMRDKVNSERPLKPDILGLLCPNTPDEKISWKDVATFIEVKDQQHDAVKQLATYARSHLSLDRKRSFSIAITFNHKVSTLCFYCFHRSGVSFSPQLCLKHADDFRSVVKHIVGIMSIPDEAAFGLDMTRIKDVYRLNDRNYDIVCTIQRSESICGHATIVYSLKLQTTGALDTPASLQSRKLACVGTELPEKIVYKLSYQPQARPSEGTLFSKFRGQFGIVDVVGSHICSAGEVFGSTAHHLLNPVFEQLDSDKKEDTSETSTSEPEIRYLHCIAMDLEGLPLTTDTKANAPTPPELVEAILHAIIGHYNLFLGGILHRDVSCGNILRLKEPIKRDPGLVNNLLRDFSQDVDLSQCRGIIIDGDHAIEWRKGGTGLSTERSGTLPFVSTRLLNTWDAGEKVLHTAADDLESFIWVLIRSLISIFKVFTPITNERSNILRLERAFSSCNFNEIVSRETLARFWRDKIFVGLIKDWLRIARRSRDSVIDFEMAFLAPAGDRNDVLNDLDKHCGDVYKAFIRTGYQHLETIRMRYSNWRDVMDCNNGLLNT